MRNEGCDRGDVSRDGAELLYRAMNRRLASVLNWLDALRTRVEFARFECLVRTNTSGDTDIELRNLKVWLYFDERRYWIAQGLDVGYAAAAKDAEVVKQKFMRGLAVTLLLNLEKHGTVVNVLRPAPPEVWIAWRRAVRSSDPLPPKRVVSGHEEVVPGLRAPVPKLELSFYGCPA